MRDAGRFVAPLPGGRAARGPDDVRIYAIGDVHGRSDLLRELWRMIDEETAREAPGRTIEIMLGDLIDRGPDSAEVVECVIERSTRHSVTVLRGNHEQYAIDALAGIATLPRWLAFGGAEALKSYGVDPGPDGARRAAADIAADFRKAFPSHHRRFISALPDMARHADYLFVHAGIRPGVPLDRQDSTDLVMIRDGFLDDDTPHDFIIVHGHTPVAAPEIRPNRIGIDTKAWESGHLTALVIEGEELRFLNT